MHVRDSNLPLDTQLGLLQILHVFLRVSAEKSSCRTQEFNPQPIVVQGCNYELATAASNAMDAVELAAVLLRVGATHHLAAVGG